ncbi:hypothetical protein [Paraburkholderia sp. ZP32-5]|uniref:hypothetical protein n=1 Tax=Paraburkholderia sp. ZP32-5 TaxID=2883245 RepID=UPI001F36598E|nr:hypothetical protein [Paraburkholderia sp. ZP32-5]
MSLSSSKHQSPMRDQITPDEWQARIVLPTAYRWVPLGGVMNVKRVSLRNHGPLKFVCPCAAGAFKSIRLLDLVCWKQLMAMTGSPEQVTTADDIARRMRRHGIFEAPAMLNQSDAPEPFFER